MDGNANRALIGLGCLQGKSRFQVAFFREDPLRTVTALEVNRTGLPCGSAYFLSVIAEIPLIRNHFL